jgi:hypothetical protein
MLTFVFQSLFSCAYFGVGKSLGSVGGGALIGMYSMILYGFAHIKGRLDSKLAIAKLIADYWQ